MLELTSKIVRNNDRFLLSALGNEIVMMDTQSGAYIGLNDVSSTLWNYLDTATTGTELVIKLLAEYDIEPSKCEEQTLQCLQKMEAQGIIVAA